MKYLLIFMMLIATTFCFSAEKGGEFKELREKHHQQMHELRADHQKEIDAFVADKPKLKELVEKRRAAHKERSKKVGDKRSDHKHRKNRNRDSDHKSNKD